MIVNEININRTDVYWNFVATFFKIASVAILLPFILHMMPSETVAIWTVFISVTSFIALLDFGFNASFTRNVSYVFSGVTEFAENGIVFQGRKGVDYSLLKGTISAMQWYYLRISLILFLFLIVLGTMYISYVIQSYSGDKKEVYIAWSLLCIISSYNLYTLYYEALIQGAGLIKKSKQIVIISQCVYLVVAITLVMFGYNLIAIVSAQMVSVLLARTLSHYVFFSSEMVENLRSAVACPKMEIIKIIFPNAAKLGVTLIGSFLENKSALFIGALYLDLDEIASYGITMQVVVVIISLAGVYSTTYMPLISKYRVNKDLNGILLIYKKSIKVLVGIFVLLGCGMIFLGNLGLMLIGSQTLLLSKSAVLVALVVAALATNHGLATSILLTDNRVLFYKASLYSGILTVVLVVVFCRYTSMGAMSLILAQGISQVVYQNWKWPLVLIKDLKSSSETSL